MAQDTAETAAVSAVAATDAAASAGAAAEEASMTALSVQIVNAIGDSYTVPSDILSAIDAGDGTATIKVAEHIRRYTDLAYADVLIAAVDLPGIPYNVSQAVYYDDPTLADQTPVMIATADIAEAQVGVQFGRFSLGVVVTPAAAGAPPSSGGGYSPPGGGRIPRANEA